MIYNSFESKTYKKISKVLLNSYAKILFSLVISLHLFIAVTKDTFFYIKPIQSLFKALHKVICVGHEIILKKYYRNN